MQICSIHAEQFARYLFRNVKNSRSTVAATNAAFPTVVVMQHQHNHAIDIAAALKFRDMGPETKQTLLELFRHGHTASSALNLLKTDLLLQHGDDYYKVAADGHYVPSASKVQKLYESEFKLEYGAMTGNDMIGDLERLLAEYSSKGNGGVAKFGRCNDQYFVAICSPVMARAHQKLSQTSELVMVDAAGGMDRQRHRVYFFVTPTAAGGIPVGVIVSSSEQQEVFDAAVSCLKSCLPDGSFYGTGCPRVFLTDNDLKERTVLQQQFASAVLLLCVFHVLKAFWAWLKDASHGVCDRSDRQELYFRFKSLVYSTDRETLEMEYSRFTSSPVYAKYPKFRMYFGSVWQLRSDWAQCYRKDLPMRGSNTTNYVEIVFRVLKDNIFDRTQAFNLTQLVDFILTRYESYVVQRLVDFCNDRYTKSLLRNMLPNPAGIPATDITEVSSEFGIFAVHSQHSATTDEVGQDQDQGYTVDIVRGYCSCFVGNAGKLCKHASAVLLHLDMQISTAYNIVSPETKSLLFQVALGTSVPHGWLAKLNEPTESARKSIFPSASTASTASTSAATPSDTDSTFHPTQPAGVQNADGADGAADPEIILTTDEQEQLQQVYDRITAGLTSNPGLFVPAVKKCLQTYSTMQQRKLD